MRFELVRELLRYDEARRVFSVCLAEIFTGEERMSKTDKYQRNLEKVEIYGNNCVDMAAKLAEDLFTSGYDVSRIVFCLTGDSRWLIWTSEDGYYWANKPNATRSEGERLTFGREAFLHV
jgi:hypothetical protein